jgi:hypothetical protein
MENEEIVRGKMGGYQNPESGEDQYPAISQNILDIGGTLVRYNLQICISRSVSFRSARALFR